MKRTLLIGKLLMLVIVGGAATVKEFYKERITILEAKVIRLQMPTQGYQP
jgi:hypothetical protein